MTHPRLFMYTFRYNSIVRANETIRISGPIARLIPTPCHILTAAYKAHERVLTTHHPGLIPPQIHLPKTSVMRTCNYCQFGVCGRVVTSNYVVYVPLAYKGCLEFK